MISSTVGIYVSPKNVDIVELTGKPSEPRVLNFVRQPIPAVKEHAGEAEAEESGEQRASLLQKDAVIFAIKDGLQKLNIKSDSIYTVMVSSDVMIRRFTMPQLPRGEQLKAAKFEARKYIPFKLDEVVSDFKLLVVSRIKKVQDVVLIAAPKESVSLHIDTYKKAGLTPIGIDIIPFSLIRMALLAKKVSVKENVAMLYLDNDRESASIHILERGFPFFSRELKISPDDKDASVEKIVSELRVSFDYYRRQSPQAEISKIVVCGEDMFAGLDAIIADELKIITTTMKELTNIKAAERIPPSYIIAAGIALGGLKRHEHSVNLSPFVFVLKKKKTANFLLIESIAVFCLVTTIFGLSQLQIQNLTSKLNAVKKAGAEVSSTLIDNTIKKLQDIKTRELAGIKFLEFAFNNRMVWTEKLDRIPKYMPEGVWVKSLNLAEEARIDDKGYPSNFVYTMSINGEAFTLSGAEEVDLINTFLTSMKKDAIFIDRLGDIILNNVSTRQDSGYEVTSYNISTTKN